MRPESDGGGIGGRSRGANEELTPGTPGPDRCPPALELVPVIDGPRTSSCEGYSRFVLN